MSGNRVFVGTSSGLFILDAAVYGRFRIVKRLAPHLWITSICAGADTAGGLGLATTKDGLVLQFSDDECITRSELGARLWFVGPTSGGKLFAGGTPARLFASRDGGLHWSSTGQIQNLARVKPWHAHSGGGAHVHSLCKAGTHSDRILYVAAEVGGVLRSDDEGATWRDITSNLDPDVHRIAVDSAGTLFAATGTGLHRYSDASHAWANLGPTTLPYVQGLVINLADDQLYISCSALPFGRRSSGPFVGTHASNVFGIFRLDEHGEWSRLTQPRHVHAGVLSKALATGNKSGQVFAGTVDGRLLQLHHEEFFEAAVGLGLIECVEVSH